MDNNGKRRGRPSKAHLMERALARQHIDPETQCRINQGCACDECRAVREVRMRRWSENFVDQLRTLGFCRCVQTVTKEHDAVLMELIEQCENQLAAMMLVWETTHVADSDWDETQNELVDLMKEAVATFNEDGGVHNCV